MFYFLRNVTLGLETSRTISEWILNNFDIYIIALANPDGRDYIEKFKNYCWRGTRNGVDINRNFDWNFGDIGSSKDPNDGEYRGPYAFSEPETGVFRELSQLVRYDAFVSFHSGIRHIYTPFADSNSKRLSRVPRNFDRMTELAKLMANSSPSRPFQSGLAYELNGYAADGTSFDYMSGIAQIPFSFAIEMWGHVNHVGDSCFDEFNLESEKLQEMESSYLKMKRSLNVTAQISESFEDLKVTASKMPSAFHEELLPYLMLAFLAALFAIIGSRHFCCYSRKKHIVSLKSLSSTFSLFKSL
ncbi:carbamoyl-phosphate synthase (glutamine-hydrolyzing) cpa2 [Bulinus truncatus]|nr:carbamoyl-phosphate synthase (glutamine-hydrolyzing) cpa2 [Bulinus truncatus]